MATIKSQRAAVRTQFTKAVTESSEELKKEVVDPSKMKLLFKKVARHHEKLLTLNGEMEEQLKTSASDEAAFQTEYEGVTKYSDDYFELEEKLVQLKLLEVEMPIPDDAGSQAGASKKYKLPVLEYKKFSGEPKEWLGFWNQFRSIHDDPEIPDELKFQYLIQTTAEKSKAREVVESFPPSKENYDKAVTYLKERFGADDVLVEVYVRDLLRLVLCNLSNKKIKISEIYDKLETQLRALESLGVTSDKYAAMLYPLVESSLPSETLRVWERSKTQLMKGKKVNKLQSLMEFLRAEVESETRIEMAKNGFNSKKSHQSHQGGEHENSVATVSELFYSGSSKLKCTFCEKDNHASHTCYLAAKMTFEDKERKIKENKACYHCLNVGHFTKKCRVTVKCQLCNKRHYALMCKDNPKNQKTTVGVNESKTAETSTTLSNYSVGSVALQTLIVKVRNGNVVKNARVLLDSGSQQSFISRHAVSVLGYQPIGKVVLKHCVFGGATTGETNHNRYLVDLQSLDGKYSCQLEMLDEKAICGKINRASNGPWLQELQQSGIKFSDVGAETPDIHILIGADYYGKLLTGNVKRSNSGPVGVEFKLGWTVMGRMIDMTSDNNNTLTITQLHLSNVDLQDLWRLDILGIVDPIEKKTKEDCAANTQKYFEKTVATNKEGRYEVALPWIEGHLKVSENREIAVKCLDSVIRKLKRLDKLNEYGKIFMDWNKLGIIEQIEDDDSPKVSYLPHHAVIKLSSSTTPIRPVFNASAKGNGQPSLNQCLEKGPNALELIPNIFLKFRLRKHGVVSDIEKAFLQICLREQDRDFLRFLWRDENDKLIVYRHRRVVFGVTCSPYLLAAVLKYHLDTAENKMDKWKDTLLSSMYVDNSVTSVNSLDEVKNFMTVSTNVLREAHFNLRGWTWNGSELEDVKKSDERQVVPVLGMLWNTTNDKLTLDINEEVETCEPVTKRKMLSYAHQVFDPMGFCSPVTLLPKMLLQETWKQKLGWDDEVDEDTGAKFTAWFKEVPLLKNILINRWYGEGKKTVHVFTDASKAAYGASIYLRIEKEKEISCELVIAKARVASTKGATIPRLELLGCLIGVRLSVDVLKSLDEEVACTFWTDSSNALYWIKNHENWAQFVWNRVEEIRKFSHPDQCKHVNGENNPADVPSRGCTASQLINSEFINGPNWLKKPEEEWPKSDVQFNLELIMTEKKKTIVAQVATKMDTPWYNRYYSRYRKIVRLVAWTLRLVKKIKKQSFNPGDLTVDEELEAEKRLWIMVQNDAFCNSPHLLKQLRTVTDKEGLIRVKSRIVMRNDSEDFRYPVLLPTNNDVVKKMITHYHLLNHHSGIQTTLNILREKVWIIQCRRNVKSVVHKCVRCQRFDKKIVDAVEAPLPVDRVRDAAVFEVIGVDLGGPLFIKNNQKVWFAVYTCAVYRAVHLELLTGLSTEAFLQGLRRFIARRGRPTTIYSDNGTNFMGLKNAKNKLNWKKITDATGIQQIRWVFNSPSAPWWGGFFERIVRMVKSQLKRILGRASLDYEELSTCLCDVESIINSRPLSYIGENDEMVPLSPAMFLCDQRDVGVPDLDCIEAEDLGRRYRYRQELKEHLRRRFRIEYLGNLVHRQKNTKGELVKIGDVVLIASDDKKRLDWPLAKVLELFPGRDGVVRSLLLKTARGEIQRPIQRIVRLEMDENKTGSDSDILRTKSGRVVKKPDRYEF